MINFLLKKFAPGVFINPLDRKVRENCTVLAGVLGVLCNLLLFSVKLTIGTLMNSIAITSDAFNNLSDMGSSVVSIFGAKISNKRPDKEHPYGHGRLEYISSLIVSFIIMLVGFELLKSSFEKLRAPENIQFSAVLVIILIISLSVKLWMFFYNNYIGKKINSSILLASSKDSINDCISTSVVIASILIEGLCSLPFSVDGAMGIIVSLLILRSGYGIAKKVVGLLLGSPPEPETIKKIEEMILNRNEIVGVHDLMVHDYGPGRIFASVHAEVADTSDIIHVHEIIDETEQQIENELNITIVIHMDPISIDDENTVKLREFVCKEAKEIDPRITVHDFRITDGENRIKLIFDMVIPVETTDVNRESMKNTLAARIEDIDSRYRCVIKIDPGF